jgi:hypothetical protein
VDDPVGAGREEPLDSNAASRGVYSAEDEYLANGLPAPDQWGRETALRLTRGEAPIFVVLLWLGLWAASWVAVTSLRPRSGSVNLPPRCRQILQRKRAILRRADPREAVRICRAGPVSASSSLFRFVASAPGSGTNVPSPRDHAIATSGELTAEKANPLSLDTLQAAEASPGNRSRLHRHDRPWRP